MPRPWTCQKGGVDLSKVGRELSMIVEPVLLHYDLNG